MYDRDYKNPEYKIFRMVVKKRDYFTCQFPNCGRKPKRLHVHHIKRWSDFPELRFVVSNGITLCYIHHKLVTGKEEQYEQLFQQIVLSRISVVDKGNDNFLVLLMKKYENY